MTVSPTAVVPHGTDGGYSNHKCRCPDCRAAHAAYLADYRGRIRASTPFHKIPHGNNGYCNYACRCLTCTDAHRDAAVRLRENRLRGGDQP